MEQKWKSSTRVICERRVLTDANYGSAASRIHYLASLPRYPGHCTSISSYCHLSTPLQRPLSTHRTCRPSGIPLFTATLTSPFLTHYNDRRKMREMITLAVKSLMCHKNFFCAIIWLYEKLLTPATVFSENQKKTEPFSFWIYYESFVRAFQSNLWFANGMLLPFLDPLVYTNVHSSSLFGSGEFAAEHWTYIKPH